jgi:hypothetical protein
MAAPNDPTTSHGSLDAVIAAYMLAVEAGDVPIRQELLDRHPEHAREVCLCTRALDRIREYDELAVPPGHPERP